MHKLDRVIYFPIQRSTKTRKQPLKQINKLPRERAIYTKYRCCLPWTTTVTLVLVKEPFWGTSWFSQQTEDYFVQLTPFYSLVQCHEGSSTPILQLSPKSVLHPFLYLFPRTRCSLPRYDCLCVL